MRGGNSDDCGHDASTGTLRIDQPVSNSYQNVFVLPEGGMKHTMAELERRKFTAEEGVSWSVCLKRVS